MPGSKRSTPRFRTSRPHKGRFKGSKTEITRKAVPRISTLNEKIKKLTADRELKYEDYFNNDKLITEVATTANDQVFLINGVSQGIGNDERTGDEIMPTSIQWRGLFSTRAVATAGVSVRMIIFWDRQPNGAAPTITGNPETAAVLPLLNTATVSNFLVAPFCYEAQERYRVLFDKVYILNPNYANGAVTSPFRLHFKGKISLSRKIKYKGDDALIASIATNSLYVVWIGSQPTATEAVNQPTMDYGARLYFKDP